MTEASEIIERIVENMDRTISGSFNELTGRYETCKTKWARIGVIVFDANTNAFLVNEVQNDQYIVAEPLVQQDPPLVLDGIVTLASPVFMTGTKMATRTEWEKISPDLTEKLPLIWLLEVINETGYGRGSSFERDINARLFFLDQTDPNQYYTKQHREYVVQPMQGLMEEFLLTIDRMLEFKSLERWQYKTFSRFGVEGEKGELKNILDANLSGVSLDLQITRYKQNCKC